MKTKLALVFLSISQTLLFSATENQTNSVEFGEVQFQDFQKRVFKESRKENHRNSSLDYHLSERKIKLPNNDFLLIAHQPQGVVSSCIVIDLEKRIVRILPATHENREEKIIELTPSEYDYITELNASSIMKNFPAQSGNFGLGGSSLVIYSQSQGYERQISHWKPEYMGLDIFRSIHNHFKKN